MQEFALGGDLNHNIKTFDASTPDKKHETLKLVLQTFLTYYFMNINLNIGHNDSKPQNVLVQEIQQTNISYKIGDKYINIPDVDKLALVTDFDKSRDNSNPFEKEYIMDFYVKYVSQVVPQVQTTLKHIIDKLYSLNKTTPERNLKYDICMFIIMTIKRTQYFMRFLNDLIIEDKPFFECITTHFADVCNISDSVNLDYKLYNTDVKISKTYLDRFKMLYLCAFNDDEIKLYGYNKSPEFTEYLNRVYGLDRKEFKCKPSENTRKNFEHIKNIDVKIASPHITNQKRKNLYDYVNREFFEKSNFDICDRIRILKILNYVLINNTTLTFFKFFNYVFICMYIVNNNLTYVNLIKSIKRVGMMNFGKNITSQEVISDINELFEFLEVTAHK